MRECTTRIHSNWNAKLQLCWRHLASRNLDKSVYLRAKQIAIRFFLDQKRLQSPDSLLKYVKQLRALGEASVLSSG